MTKVAPPSEQDLATATPCWHKKFLAMLPKIQEQARYQFRHLKGDHQDEAVQEVICNCCLAYARLVEQGRAEAATWSTLSRYGIAQVRVGRRVGNSLNVKDVTSPHCQLRKQVGMQSLHRWNSQKEEWIEMVVEDRHSTPADLASFRIDFREFLRSLSRRNRQIALQLCKGETNEGVARRFRITMGRVSQLRRELCEAWREFQGLEALASPA
jgi:hypothetical protein